MPRARDQVLSRCLEAAKILAYPSNTTETSPSQPAKQDDANKWDTSNDDIGDHKINNEGEELDSTSAAMVELLARQAGALAKLHEALKSDSSHCHTLNEKLFLKRIKDILSISTSKFYSYRYDLVPTFWRELYTNAIILETHYHLLRPLLSTETLPEETLDLVVGKLDRALITTGGAGKQLGSRWIETTLQALEDLWHASQDDSDRPCKRQKQGHNPERSFSTEEPFGRPTLSGHEQCPRYSGWTMDKFEDYMNDDGNGAPWPIIFTDLIATWPAFTHRPWKRPDYLLSQTFGGRRLVPVEVGRSYVDEGWGQELIPFKTFLERYVDTRPPPAAESSTATAQRTGYLAQHNLFRQIPALRNDIQVPNFCWVDVPPHPVDPSKNRPPLDVPSLNAWFGPARTITPLHTDGYHNLLCQVVGTKYVRLYPPWATQRMRPRGPEHGVDMSNTSELDVGVLEGWDEVPEDMTEDDVKLLKEGLKGVEYRECVLAPGDTLVIPIGWWHYVRSLSVSFSVSFWWN